MDNLVGRLRKYGSGSLCGKAAAEIERLRDLLAFNSIDPDAVVESAKGAAQPKQTK